MQGMVVSTASGTELILEEWENYTFHFYTIGSKLIRAADSSTSAAVSLEAQKKGRERKRECP
ncbi:hypothetical protein ACQJBY_031576 [Aegilops geniculata]